MYQPENKKVSISVIFVYFVRPPLLGCRPDPPGLLARTSPGSKLPGPARLRAIRVIVRSAHSAPVRRICKPRSLFFVYAPSVCLRRCAAPTNKVKTATGVPPVSIHVIVRSAHSALARKFF